MPYFKRSGHCTRCEALFDPGAIAFMVREETINEVFPNGAYSYLRTVVAACEACIAGEERERLRLLPMMIDVADFLADIDVDQDFHFTIP
jgi:hypothetical protein